MDVEVPGAERNWMSLSGDSIALGGGILRKRYLGGVKLRNGYRNHYVL